MRAVDARRALGERLGRGVIVAEPLAMVAQCVQCGGGEDARLAHAAAPHLAEAARALDGLARRAERAAHRARRGPSRSRR